MREAIGFLLPYLLQHRRGMVLGGGALVAKVLLAALAPLLIRAGVDRLAKGADWSAILTFAGALLSLNGVVGFFRYWQRVLLVGLSRDLEFDIRTVLFAHLTSMPREFFARFQSGDIMSRVTSDLNHVRMMSGPGLMYFAETLLTFFIAFSVMLYVDWVLALAALIPMPLISYAEFYYGGKIHDIFEEIQGLFAGISSRVQESISNIRLLRAYRQEDAEMALFAKMNEKYIGRNLQMVRSTGVFDPLLEMLAGLSLLIVLWIGGWRVLQGHISFGSFVMFQTYMVMLVWPMIAMGWVVNLTQRGIASLGRIRQFLDVPPSIAAPDKPRVLERVNGEVTFEAVTVAFRSGDALASLSLQIRAGETVAVVGHTGGGKSTLVSLIPRLLDPSSGRVLLDGVDLRELNPQDLRRQIAVVPQETFLFSLSLHDNIALGRQEATREEVARVAEIAGLSADVAQFPAGFDTVIGERGITLSGGQRQRTAIARAILRDPRILILDDALSSVDTETEERILRQLSAEMKGRTTLLISHRVSTIRHASRIVVLEHGRIVEAGSHQELLAQNGYYADLARKQQLEDELLAL